MSIRNPARTLRKSSDVTIGKVSRRDSPKLYKHGKPPSQDGIF